MSRMIASTASSPRRVNAPCTPLCVGAATGMTVIA